MEEPAPADAPPADAEQPDLYNVAEELAEEDSSPVGPIARAHRNWRDAYVHKGPWAGRYGELISDADTPLCALPDAIPDLAGPVYCDDIGCGETYCDEGLTLWVRPEYLMWWVDGWDRPPLVTGSPTGTGQVLVGNDHVLDGMRSGVRIQFGFWIDPCKTVAVEANYFGLESLAVFDALDSPGDPFLGRPLYDITPGSEGQAVEGIANVGILAGNVDVRSRSSLQGVEVLLRRSLLRQCGRSVDVLVGWRLGKLDEELAVHDFKTLLVAMPPLAQGTTIEEYDRFATCNVFQGAELGLAGQLEYCQWSCELVAKLALGSTHSRVAIEGGTATVVPVAGGAPDSHFRRTGLLALDTNSGIHEDDQFAVMPELGITLGRQLTPRLRATVGYTFIYWSSVVRPGDVVDTTLNLSQLEDTGLVGPVHPKFAWVRDDLWAQGINLGLDWRY